MLGTSVIAVVSRPVSRGFRHGITTSIGIVLGNIGFILIAIFVLSLVAEAMEDLFLWVKFIADLTPTRVWFQFMAVSTCSG